MVSYGPCQTPTLGFCVDRHGAIVCFTPEDFWVLEVEVHKSGVTVPLQWDRGRVFDREVASLFECLVSEAGGVTVGECRREKGAKARPLPFNTVEMLKVASKALGMGPSSAMATAERLYLGG